MEVTRYRTIVADPPWSYRNSGSQGGVGEHYGTMTNAEIAALPVSDIAADNAHLYLWVTNPRLFAEKHDNGVGPKEIVEAWGFRYITTLTWLKEGALGLGYYWRGETEHVLFAIRGDAGIPPALRERNWFNAPKRRHSEKPESFFDAVERVSPAPRAELFARRNRLGWDTFGNESLGQVELAA